MTERKKISLARPAAPTTDSSAGRKPPVRGSGTAPRKRMTATQAEQARADAAQRRAEAPAAPRGWHDDAPGTRAARPSRDERHERRDRDARGPQGPGSREGSRDARDSRAERGSHGERRAPDARPGHPDRADRSSRRDAPSHAQRDEARSAPRPAPTPRPAPLADADGRIRLSKLMSERGLASRREADEWIEAGWVRVNGEVVAELGSRFTVDVVIDIDPQAHQEQVQRVTILLHKPIGYVSGQAEDGYEPAVTLIQPDNRWAEDKAPIKLNRGHLRKLAPAGRLDIDSTGLLVLTQDGRVAKQLIGEDSGVEKEYLVRVQLMSQPEVENVSAATDPEAIEHLRFGLELDGKPLKPAQVSWQNEQQLRVVLREGRKRQIRRMCELVGLKVVGLKRVRMGRVVLGKLPVGQWRFLRPDERF